ncbi:P22 phage major capsid protein family protein [Pseudonocardia sp. McavD-2-B]|uniref:P22 phage major capsid protein family protein n=1 Tax=Pseudonocardia sp. McavD-2-B TaxID=2954499 RepID=UPI00209714F8|nr:P22 phage major capsid protein family protein [Pseudonocardia sp. McavD-2-B]MCO7195390.1 hypothetical protein [Pseudonocardia sp. McavD-2-B]
MANELLTPKIIARQAIVALYQNLVMAGLVHRDYEREFMRPQKIGDTITIRRPTTFEAREFDEATGIEIQNAQETSTDLTLNHHLDVSFEVSSKDLTLTVQDFDEQFLTPAMEAHAQGVDRSLLALRDDIATVVGTATEHIDGEDYKGYRGNFPWSDSRVVNQAGTVLTKRNVPLTRRRVVTGPETAGLWTTEDTWRQANQRGDTVGLREATIGGRIAGFDPYMTQNIVGPAEGTNGTEMGVAFHESAFALATRPLELPMGSQRAEIVSYKGLNLRVVYDYDHKYKKDVVSLDMLFGAKTINPDRAVLIGNASYDPDAPRDGEDTGSGGTG